MKATKNHPLWKDFLWAKKTVYGKGYKPTLNEFRIWLSMGAERVARAVKP